MEMQEIENISTDTYCVNLCKKNRLKVTPQRIIILEHLMKDKSHPSAESIYIVVKKKLPGISFDTVNRTLNTFTKLGFIDMIESISTPRRFDGDTDNHHHFCCEICDEIYDFKIDDLTLPEIPVKIKNEFVIKNMRVVLRGICPKCKQDNKDADNTR
jgi:Fur family transcriptional regulator, peroxide stress response regulator